LIIRYLLVFLIIASFSIGGNFSFAGLSTSNTSGFQATPCLVPLSGDWIVTSNCTLMNSVTVPANVWIQNNSVLTIPNQITLFVDFENNNLTVFSGSGLLILLGGTLQQQESIPGEFNDCSSGWTVTGYFIPLEADYTGEFVSINIQGISREFKQDFVDSIKLEGWGKTLSGDYLGWYSNSFHINNNAVDSEGNPLVVGIVAVDNAVVDPNSNLIIPTLPTPWNEVVFLSSDVGTGVNQKHVDVFTGIGLIAEQETFRITSNGNTVCQ
jgi:3D (Asp-Asp-Asp) domain-containing protein